MTLGQNEVWRYGHLCDFFAVFLGIEWPIWVQGLIDFKIGLYIKVNVNVGQKNL